MVPIYIDTDDISKAFFMTREQVSGLLNAVVMDVTAAFARKWQDVALRTLKGTKNDYAKGIIVSGDLHAKGTVTLTGWLNNAMESGFPAFDMKPGLLNGPNAKTLRDGKTKYNTVPFSHGTPTALPDSALFSSILPSEVYNAIQKKPQDVKTPSGGLRTKGLQASEIPEPYREPITRGAPPNTDFKAYTHKNAIYEGVSKYKDPVTGQNTYKSFRRVSSNSDPNSWVHHGFKAKNLSEQALGETAMQKVMAEAADRYLKSIGLV